MSRREPLRLGVVGAGIALEKLHLPRIAKLPDAFRIVAVATSNPESAATGAQLVEAATGAPAESFSSVDAMLEKELDVVLLNVPISATHQLALRILEAGVPLICEKPLAESADLAAEVVRSAEQRSLFLGVCENFRYQGRFGQVAELVATGLIGDPKVYFLNDLHYTPADGLYSVTPWRQRGDHRGGYLLDGGSHIVAGLRAMVSETPVGVAAVATSFHPHHLGRPWDTALVNFTFGSGLVGHLTLGYGSPDREARHPKILGTSGTLALKKDGIDLWRESPDDDETIPLEDSSDGIDAEWDDFARALTEGQPLRFSPWEAVRDLAVLDAILESAASEGVRVNVRALGGE